MPDQSINRTRIERLSGEEPSTGGTLDALRDEAFIREIKEAKGQGAMAHALMKRSGLSRREADAILQAYGRVRRTEAEEARAKLGGLGAVARKLLGRSH